MEHTIIITTTRGIKTDTLPLETHLQEVQGLPLDIRLRLPPQRRPLLVHVQHRVGRLGLHQHTDGWLLLDRLWGQCGMVVAMSD